jgi:hypothetical protein
LVSFEGDIVIGNKIESYINGSEDVSLLRGQTLQVFKENQRMFRNIFQPEFDVEIKLRKPHFR